jgi:adenine-specific DNA-methyltransferase
LSGRDVKRFESPQIKQFLIFFPKGFTNKHRGETEPNLWIKLNYPAIYEHLIIYHEKAVLRGDKGDYWWELRACDYYQEFDKEKIIIPSIIKRPECIIDSRNFYSNDKTSIIGTDSKYVLSILNSRITHYLMQQIASTKQGGFLEYKPVYISQISIPQIIAEAQTPFIEKVNQILTLKKADSKADTSELEAQIDRMVYDLYELTEEEILIVEGK